MGIPTQNFQNCCGVGVGAPGLGERAEEWMGTAEMIASVLGSLPPLPVGAGGHRGDGEEHPFCLPSLPPLTVPASLKQGWGRCVCVYKEWAAGARAWRSHELGTSGSEGRGEDLSEAPRA